MNFVSSICRRAISRPQSGFRRTPGNAVASRFLQISPLQRIKINPNEKEPQKPVAKILPNLSQVLKIELLTEETAENISYIWNQHHSSNFYCISACIPGGTYVRLKHLMETYPIFLLPLPREGEDGQQGGEFFVMQYTNNIVGFTRLANYQKFNIHAPRALTLMHYTELLQSKDLVLMRGEIDPQQLTSQESQLLVNQLQLYFLSPEGLELVKIFNKTPEKFDYNQLLSLSLPSLNLGAASAGESNNTNTNDTNNTNINTNDTNNTNNNNNTNDTNNTNNTKTTSNTNNTNTTNTTNNVNTTNNTNTNNINSNTSNTTNSNNTTNNTNNTNNTATQNAVGNSSDEKKPTKFTFDDF